MSAFRSITLSAARGLNEQLINELESKLGYGRECQPARLLPVRAQRSGFGRLFFQTAGQWLTTCFLTRRKENYEQNSF